MAHHHHHQNQHYNLTNLDYSNGNVYHQTATTKAMLAAMLKDNYSTTIPVTLTTSTSTTPSGGGGATGSVQSPIMNTTNRQLMSNRDLLSSQLNGIRSLNDIGFNLNGGVNIMNNGSSSSSSSSNYKETKLNKNFKLNNAGTNTNNNGSGYNSLLTSDIERELTDLTLSIEREMEKQKITHHQQTGVIQPVTHSNGSINNSNNNSNDYYSTNNSNSNVCFKCSRPITDRLNDACQAMGNTYHASCFVCVSCGRSLKGKPFYNINNHVYCEEDYLYSGFLENAEKCSVCGHIIVDMILQAIGKSYHPGCFRCYNCNDCLDGQPFTLDVNNRIYCIKDYYKRYAPKCAKCKQAITPPDGTTETIRIVSMEKDFHVECFVCEDCDTELTDEPRKRCYPLGNRLLCFDCHIKNIEIDSFAKILIENSNNENSVIIDKKK